MLDQLPDDSSFEDIQYHIYVREKIGHSKVAAIFRGSCWISALGSRSTATVTSKALIRVVSCFVNS